MILKNNNELFALYRGYYYVGNYSCDLRYISPYVFIYEKNFQILEVLRIVSPVFLLEQKSVLINNVFCLITKESNTTENRLKNIIGSIEKMVEIYKERKLFKPILFPMEIFDDDIYDKEIVGILYSKCANIDIIINSRG
jgi:hypothetical protein